jgi:citrate lyase beta subunit
MLDATQLGACLYVPATHPALARIARGEKLADIRSFIFCTEDSVSDRDLPMAFRNLAHALCELRQTEGHYRFVRVRSLEALDFVLQMPGSQHIDGFVLPKISHLNFEGYMDKLRRTGHAVMPTLETREAFDERDMSRLLALMDRPQIRERICCLRIGGNDLLSLIGMRRPRGRTIYQTPIGTIISRLVTTFRPYGFNLSAPVFEYLDDCAMLDCEVEEDLHHGLIGKTAIHPNQVHQIESHYRVSSADLQAAQQILAKDSAAVFRFQGAMCEPATHRNWALSVLESTRRYGRHEFLPELPIRNATKTI